MHEVFNEIGAKEVLLEHLDALLVLFTLRCQLLERMCFLPAMEGTSRGNYGLLDQIAALHWVQENIAQFGGDPRNITLLGHGYGASCAHLLMYSPKAQGKFMSSIMQQFCFFLLIS
ncbi:neuroligin-3 [Trichonephila clavata]|uniref:Neuroligin-3 n=1 Tax=Trichonephila clavata TaxID=2740835 RepID=A0A8X6M0J9_TRICU|nr:neuroligin-3 [Trichonephila clavata]